MTLLSPESWGEWANHPVTREFLAEIKATRNEKDNLLGGGNALNYDSASATAMKYAHGVGYSEALTDLLNQIEEEL